MNKKNKLVLFLITLFSVFIIVSCGDGIEDRTVNASLTKSNHPTGFGIANCFQCHNAELLSSGNHSGFATIKQTLDNALASCVGSCHGSNGVGGDGGGGGGSCTGCHASSYTIDSRNISAVSTTGTSVHSAGSALIASDCQACHGSVSDMDAWEHMKGTRPAGFNNKTDIFAPSFGTLTTANFSNNFCLECHGTGGPATTVLYSADRHGSAGNVAALPCSDCHVSHTSSNANLFIENSGGNNIGGYRDLCSSCHTGGTVPSANGVMQTSHNTGAGCGACHAAATSGTIGTTSGRANCSGCHADTANTPGCSGCHTGNGNSGTTIMGTQPLVNCSGACHGAMMDPISSYDARGPEATAKMMGLSTPNSVCITCHTHGSTGNNRPAIDGTRTTPHGRSALGSLGKIHHDASNNGPHANFGNVKGRF